MRYVYILKVGSWDKATQSFNFYDVIPFSSKKGIRHGVKNMMEVNKAYDIENNYTHYLTDDYKMVTYKCLSTDGKEMRVRYVLTKKELKVF